MSVAGGNRISNFTIEARGSQTSTPQIFCPAKENLLKSHCQEPAFLGPRDSIG